MKGMKFPSVKGLAGVTVLGGLNEDEGSVRQNEWMPCDLPTNAKLRTIQDHPAETLCVITSKTKNVDLLGWHLSFLMCTFIVHGSQDCSTFNLLILEVSDEYLHLDIISPLCARSNL